MGSMNGGGDGSGSGLGNLYGASTEQSREHMTMLSQVLNDKKLVCKNSEKLNVCIPTYRFRDLEKVPRISIRFVDLWICWPDPARECISYCPQRATAKKNNKCYNFFSL